MLLSVMIYEGSFTGRSSKGADSQMSKRRNELCSPTRRLRTIIGIVKYSVFMNKRARQMPYAPFSDVPTFPVEGGRKEEERV
jgi:hypothetical protein